MRIPTSVLIFAVWSAMAAPLPAQADGTYVALGDSVAAPRESYVHLLFHALRTPAGGSLDTLHNRARGGETSGTLRSNGQLAAAIADIDGPSDTKVVTIDIGGNDRFVCGGRPPAWHLPSCPFAANFDATLAELQSALTRDPGPESLVAMTYYNPASGTGTPQEQDYDRGLLGTDQQLSCAPNGDARLGLNDQIACITLSRGGLVADVYPAFKRAGQALLGDAIHPNAEGHAAIAAEFSKILGFPPGTRDVAAPVIRALALAPRRFRAAPRGGSIATAAGATLSYRLSEVAETTFRVERAASGRRVGEKCVPPTRSNRRARRCRRYARVNGSFTYRGRRGANSVRFTGRLAGQKLPPSRYRLVVRAKDMAGNLSHRVRAPFAIRR